ncbi:MAG: MBL fold metallo-hydrolase [Eggerthellaceae bacterium]
MFNGISLHVLASGSKGNSSVVVNEETGEGILIDCGCRRMDLASFFEETGYDPRKICAILITHDHSDHIKSLAMHMRFFKKYGISPLVFTLDQLIKPCREKTDTDKGQLADFEVVRFEEGIKLAGLEVSPLPTSHDATASCGFFFQNCNQSSDSLAFITDTGILPTESACMLSKARLVALECNHDEKMLKYGDYPRFLKERIASDQGHLSNVQAVDLLQRYLGSSCDELVAMHLSQENNLPSVVRETVQGALDEMGSQAKLHVAKQYSRVSLG